MKSNAALLALLAVTHQASARVDKWTPEGFDWEKVPSYHGALYQNVSAGPMTKELAVYAAEQHGITDLAPVERLAIAASIGWVLRNPVTFASTIADVSGAINGCVGAFQQPSFRNGFFCGLGVLSTIAGFGLARSADKQIQSFADRLSAVNAWDGSGLESIEMGVFSKRSVEGLGLTEGEEKAQMLHNYMTHLMVVRSGFQDAEFIGYEEDHHPLSKRDGIHPFAAKFRFTHPKGGRMVVSTRDTNTTSHITLAPWFEAHEKRDNDFEHERLSDHLMEGRFDKEASQSDPATLSADPEGSFRMIEDSLECFVGDMGETAWPGQAIYDMQMYDDTNRGTFGYGSIGIFNDHGADGDLGNFQPAPPLTGGMDC